MKYLNLGCGVRFNPSWVNINFFSTGEGVIAHNLSQGIPFADESFDVIYHSHVLEHFSKLEAEKFIHECYRVLRPKGILRVVVPDLEQIAKLYLEALDKASNGSPEWDNNYQWIMLEMYDQAVRNYPGGEMLRFLKQKNIPNAKFIIDRCGVEVDNLISQNQALSNPPSSINSKTILRILKKFCCSLRDFILLLILNRKEFNSLKLGRFRQSGEVHQWMYDHYSLSIVLHQCGFKEITRRSAYESLIPDWGTFHLDTEPDGRIYKPDSLYVEALKV